MKAKDRPSKLEGETTKVSTGCGTLYVTVNMLDGIPFEIFAKLGKSGGCSACTTEALTRVISIGLRAGVDLAEYHHTLESIRCISPTFSAGEEIKSCPDAIAKIIKKYLPEENGNAQTKDKPDEH